MKVGICFPLSYHRTEVGGKYFPLQLIKIKTLRYKKKFDGGVKRRKYTSQTKRYTLRKWMEQIIYGCIIKFAHVMLYRKMRNRGVGENQTLFHRFPCCACPLTSVYVFLPYTTTLHEPRHSRQTTSVCATRVRSEFTETTSYPTSACEMRHFSTRL